MSWNAHHQENHVRCQQQKVRKHAAQNVVGTRPTQPLFAHDLFKDSSAGIALLLLCSCAQADNEMGRERGEGTEGERLLLLLLLLLAVCTEPPTRR